MYFFDDVNDVKFEKEIFFPTVQFSIGNNIQIVNQRKKNTPYKMLF